MTATGVTTTRYDNSGGRHNDGNGQNSDGRHDDAA